MKRKIERRPNWAAAPPCSRRSSSSSLGVKKSRSSTSQDLHRLDQPEDLYLDITGEPAGERVAGRPGHTTLCAGVAAHPPPAAVGAPLPPTPIKAPAGHTPLWSRAPGERPPTPSCHLRLWRAVTLSVWLPPAPARWAEGHLPKWLASARRLGDFVSSERYRLLGLPTGLALAGVRASEWPRRTPRARGTRPHGRRELPWACGGCRASAAAQEMESRRGRRAPAGATATSPPRSSVHRPSPARARGRSLRASSSSASRGWHLNSSACRMPRVVTLEKSQPAAAGRKAARW